MQAISTSGERWRIRLLGAVSLNRGPVSVTRFRSQKAAALLGCLALNPGRCQPRDRIVDLFWPDLDVDSGRNNLRVTLASLRRQLEPPGAASGSVLVASRSFIQLNPSSVETDVAAFEAALSSSKTAPTEQETASMLVSAVEAYGGDLLPGIYDSWVETERERLAAACAQALHHLIQWNLESGELSSAAHYAARALQHNPDDEDAGHVMELLRERRSKSGRTLRPDYPAAPGIARACTELRVSSGMPPSFTSFHGRASELGALRELLERESPEPSAIMITVTGPGGCGKTRVAAELARSVECRFGGSVRFVALAEARDVHQVESAVCDALGIAADASDSRLEAAIDWMARSLRLLVLDNCEQLLQGNSAVDFANVVQRIRAGAPELHVLATSRQPIGLEGERLFPLDPLPAPAGADTLELLIDCASIQLFVFRAQAVRPSFRLTSHNAADVAEICRRLEGLPLAIELAAAWSNVLTPAQIRSQLADRFDLLVSRRAGAPSRHRTMRDAIAWSVDSLPAASKELLSALAMFRGGWTVEAAGAVRGGPGHEMNLTGQLGSLIERSLVAARPDGRSGTATMRYSMLETVREFAAQTQPDSVRRRIANRHLDYYLAFASACAATIEADQRAALDRMESELDNLRTALDWAAESERFADGLALAIDLASFWEIRGHIAEGRRRLTVFLDRVRDEPLELRASGALAAASLAHVHCDYETAESLYNRAREQFAALGNRRSVAETLRRRHAILLQRGDYEHAESDLRESLEVFVGLRDNRAVASVTGLLANVARERRRFEEAERLYEESLALYRSAGDEVGLSVALCDYAFMLEWRGEYDRAIHRLEESLSFCRALGNLPGLAHTLWMLGNAVAGSGDLDSAVSHCEESLAIHRRLGRRAGVAYCLGNLGEFFIRRGDLHAARQVFEERLATCRQINDRQETARSLGFLGQVARMEQRFAASRSHFAERLAIYRLLGHSRGEIIALCDLAAASAAHEPGRWDGRHLSRAARALQDAEWNDSSLVAYFALAASAAAAALQRNADASRLYSAALARSDSASMITQAVCYYPDPGSRVIAGRLTCAELRAANEEGHRLTDDQVLNLALSLTAAT